MQSTKEILTVDNKIMDKIAAILARANSDQNDNEHERAIAMRQATTLLTKHGLSMSDVTDQGERKESMGALGRKEHRMTTRYIWEAGTWDQLARLNNCKVIRNGRNVWIVGRQLHCNVTAALAVYVVDSIKREAKRQGHTICSFGVGAWRGISVQVKEMISQRNSGLIDGVKPDQSTALRVIDENKQAIAETSKAFSTFYPNARSSSYGYGGNQDSVSAGRAYGQNINLSRGGNSRQIGQQ